MHNNKTWQRYICLQILLFPQMATLEWDTNERVSCSSIWSNKTCAFQLLKALKNAYFKKEHPSKSSPSRAPKSVQLISITCGNNASYRAEHTNTALLRRRGEPPIHICAHLTWHKVFLWEHDLRDRASMNREGLKELRARPNCLRVLYNHPHCSRAGAICNLNPIATYT